MMYYQHFGLTGAPFQLTPSPRMLFASRSHYDGLVALEKCLSECSGGLTLVSGPFGSGKTTLAMATLARNWGRSRVLYLANAKAGWAAMLREIMRQLGIAEHGSQYEMVNALRHHLNNLAIGSRILILIDEAHYLGEATLVQIGEFLRSDSPGFKGLSFALAGEPELSDRIISSHNQELHNLVVASAKLKPLSIDEAVRYVEYRLTAYEGTKKAVFAGGALEFLLQNASGSPLRINALCHNAMLLAHAERSKQVEIAAARRAVQEFASRTLESDLAESKRSATSDLRETSSTAELRGQGSTARNERNAPPPAAIIAVSKAGMGIGLTLICLFVISVIWIAEMRLPSSSWNSSSDSEVPSIFSEEANSTDGISSSGYRVNDESISSDVATSPTNSNRPNGVGRTIAQTNHYDDSRHAQMNVGLGSHGVSPRITSMQSAPRGAVTN